MTPVWRPSPNFGDRRGEARPELIVLHYTAMVDAEAALARLCDPDCEVSAHYLISRTGEVVQLVDEDNRAWHAGEGDWGGKGDVNSRSIGIELDNTGAQPFSEPLMAALEALLPGIMDRCAIPPEGVIAHSDMAPQRKADPGAKFDWRRLARQGLSVWPAPSSLPDGHASGAGEAAFLAAATAFGWPEQGLDACLGAFRLRFRPWADGPLDARDIALAEDLARRYPVDAGAGSA